LGLTTVLGLGWTGFNCDSLLLAEHALKRIETAFSQLGKTKRL